MKVKRIFTSALLLVFALSINAQKFISRSGNVKFYSYTPIEEIEGITHQAASILSASNGDILVSLLVRSFSFKIELMQEHFNENYMESDKYPKATFKGKIKNLEDIDFSRNGTYEANVEGDLTIHGVSKTVKNVATIEIINGLPVATVKFKVHTEDYGIEIPDIVREKIAKEIEISINIAYQAA